VPLFRLGGHFELDEIPVHILAVRKPRQVEEPLPERLPELRPLDGTAIGIAPRGSCIIEPAWVYDGPIQKVRPWVMRTGIGVKNVNDAELPSVKIRLSAWRVPASWFKPGSIVCPAPPIPRV
jgi:hypothetical protein